jgi:protein gp37
VRFLSIEPMLGAIRLGSWLQRSPSAAFVAGKVTATMPDWTRIGSTSIDWVICGGESGPHARPMHPHWARDLRDQCAAAGVPFFMKQMTKRAEIPADLMTREFPQ